MGFERKFKLTLDVVMYGLLLFLLSYKPGSGLLLHGKIGLALGGLFILHLTLNFRYFKSLFKGRYNKVRLSYLILNLALIVCFVAVVIRSVQMSGDVFLFSPFYSTQYARSLHTLSTAWFFVLISLHIGLHLHGFILRKRRQLTKISYKLIFNLIFLGLFISGLWAFFTIESTRNLLLLPKIFMPFNLFDFYVKHLLAAVFLVEVVHLYLSFLTFKKQ